MSAPDPAIVVGLLEHAIVPDLHPLPSQIVAFIDAGIPEEFTPVIETFLAAIPAGDRPVIARRVAGGENQKTLEAWGRRLADCRECGLDRDALLVAVGGGALGDSIGFTASAWHRGLRWIAVPTTLVAMVDAHLGGKTALNLGDHKNQVGSFWWPEAVIADPRFLETLPPRELRSGWGELIKSAWIGDPALVDLWDEEPPLDAAALLRVPNAEEIARGVAVKRAIVKEDSRESDRRRVLNFGHTLGHALETLPGLDLAHGEAVAIGMVFAAEVACDLGLAPRALVDRIRALLARLGFETEWPTDRTDELLERIAADKKNRAGQIWMALPSRAGDVSMTPIATEHLTQCLERGAETAAPEVRRGKGTR